MKAEGSQKDLAELLGLSERSVQDLAKEEGFPLKEKGKRGRPSVIVLADAVQWYIKREVKRRTGKVGDGEGGAREELYRQQATRAALENARLRGEMLDKDDVRQAMESVFGILSRHLDSAASRVARPLKVSKSEGECRRLVLDEIRNARASAARELGSVGISEDDVAPPETPTRPKSGRVGKSGKGAPRRKRKARAVPK